GVDEELVQLNEDTLWSGIPGKYSVLNAKASLSMIREALFAEDYHRANELCKRLQGPFSQSYMPMGNLRIRFDGQAKPENYLRELDLSRAVATVRYESGKTKHKRTCFVSFPDNALVLEIASQGKGGLNLTASLDSVLRNSQKRVDACTIAMSGRAPVHVDPSYYQRDLVSYDDHEGMAFDVWLRVVAEGGQVSSTDGSLVIGNARSVVFFLVSATSFNGFDRSPGQDGLNSAEMAHASLESVSRKRVDAIRATHVKDHQALFDRCSLHLGATDVDDRPTDERLNAYTRDRDPRLAALLFQYGRYLMIASSRPGTQATNLQGIWNDLFRAPWSSNYTLNLNTPMNYWPAESANLPECHEPLFDLIEKLAATGRKVALDNYGCRGWTAHHNSDLWGLACAVGDYGNGNPRWSCWPMAGAWLATHLWEHYAFTQDRKFLAEKAYPLLKQSAKFYLDWLVPGRLDGQDYLVTAPATSPENSFVAPDGKPECVSIASTMDMAIIRELFADVALAAEILDVDRNFSSKVTKARDKLLPYQLGRDGRIQEWYKDFDEWERQHRHVSHLFGLHPGSQITSEGTPALFDAATKTLAVRGDEGVGCSLAWKVNLWARLLNGDRCLAIVHRMLRAVDGKNVDMLGDGGVYPNLVNGPPFQVDGNFGVTAGICEMLLQSHERTADSAHGEVNFILRLLPALPSAWKRGAVGGLVARGNFTVDMEWARGMLVKADIFSGSGKTCRIFSDRPLDVFLRGRRVPASYERNVLEFNTAAGKNYRIVPGSGS
ncbi:MAG: glycoside hydrolase family 95 protein, partial [Rhodospirillales bacterium]|nr:glycoside hydrolase family 95 protein [Rhodospirillales bacterium]